MLKSSSKVLQMKGMNYNEALKQGYLREGPRPSQQEAEEIEKKLIEPKLNLYGLRFPEKDSKTSADYMRLSYTEEDAQFLKDQERKTLTDKEMKKMPREVLAEGWEEDMSVYSHKRKP